MESVKSVEQYRAAYQIIKDALDASCGNTPDERSIYGEAINKVGRIFNPPAEMHDVKESAGWVNVYERKDGSIFTSRSYEAKSIAIDFIGSNGKHLETQEIFTTVKRPKPRMDTLQVVVDGVSVDHHGKVYLDDNGSDTVFMQHPDAYYKTGKLIFQWEQQHEVR